MEPVVGMAGYRMNEYLLLLNPHEDLRHKIHKIQEQFALDYSSRAAVNIKPNIPLVKFTQFEMMEERFLNRLHVIAMAYHPIKIELKDYGSFPSHTIFIKVETHTPIVDLVKEIRKEAGRLFKMNEENKPHFFTEPFIPIGMKLLPWQYEKGWKEYSHRHFTGKFIADSMLLLKRRKGEKAYQIVERMEFQNLLIVTPHQGSLFE